MQTTDLYAFHLHEQSLVGGTDCITFGTRMKGDPLKLAGWDYTSELAGKAGQVLGQDLTCTASGSMTRTLIRIALMAPRRSEKLAQTLTTTWVLKLTSQ